MSPFHLAFPTPDLVTTRRFFEDVLDASVGRTSERWVDFNFFGHQITAHLVDEMADVHLNPVDGKLIPAFHFGVILDWSDWEELAQRLRASGAAFLVDPCLRFEGAPGEQGTFFIRDPGSQTALEFKTFRSFDQIFA